MTDKCPHCGAERYCSFGSRTVSYTCGTYAHGVMVQSAECRLRHEVSQLKSALAARDAEIERLRAENASLRLVARGYVVDIPDGLLAILATWSGSRVILPSDTQRSKIISEQSVGATDGEQKRHANYQRTIRTMASSDRHKTVG